MDTTRTNTITVSPRHRRDLSRVLPYGGDVAVAQSIADVHRENPWTGRCRACNEPSPCPERRYANIVLIHRGRNPNRPTVSAITITVVAIGIGTLLIAAGALGLVW